MKFFVIAAAVLGLSGSVAYADGVSLTEPAVVVPAQTVEDNFAFVGSVEYTLEAGVMEGRFGVEYAWDNFTFTPMVIGSYASSEFAFDGVELNVDYEVSRSVSVYGIVAFNGDFDYVETTIGAAFRF